MLKKLYKQIALFSILLLLPCFVWGQVYPVRLNTNLIPPYSVRLSDYTTPGYQNLSVNIALTDATKPEYKVKLRMKIEGVGITISTKSNFNPNPLTIFGGATEFFTGEDLAEYFRPDNLEFKGISKQQFVKTGSLPEGLYRICFQVLDYNRGLEVSGQSCATAWLLLNDPPIINFPANNSKPNAIDPQNIVFQWTPRHTGSPNSAFSTEYLFQLVEIWPNGRNPNDAILTSPPIFQTTTMNTNLVYGMSETPLVPGRQYAFRVQAKDIEGRDLFKNRGYSEVFMFTYGDACLLPENIVAEGLNGGRIKVSWVPTFGQTNFLVKYREAGKPDAQWFTAKTSSNNIEISQLKAEKEYEYQVRGICGTVPSEFSPVKTVKTLAMVQMVCGKTPPGFNLNNKNPLQGLKVGSIIKAGDFDIAVTKVSGGNGVYSGEGLLVVPLMNNLKVMAVFDNISINDERRLTKGKIKITGGKAQLLDDATRDLINDAFDKADNLLATAEDYVLKAEKIEDKINNVLVITNNLTEVPLEVRKQIQEAKELIAEAKEVLANGGQGADALIEKAKSIIDNVKTALASGGGQTSSSTLNTSLAKVTFNKNPNQVYGFDAKTNDALAMYYRNINNEATKKTEYISWKAVETGKAEKVDALIENPSSGFDAAKLKFTTASGIVYNAEKSADNKTFTVNITGAPSEEMQELLAYYPTSDKEGHNIGVLSVVSYEKIKKKVVLVPLEGASDIPTREEISAKLNSIYSQAVVEWEVVIADKFTPQNWDSNKDGKIATGDGGLLSNYTSEMNSINDGFISYDKGYNKETYYVFIATTSDKPEVLGFMPRGKQFGYIFKQSKEDILLTIAHELGHGAFNLKHTFDGTGVSKGTSDNLMDYNKGTALNKYQWDQIHYPNYVIGVLESEEDGEIATGPCENLFLNTFDKCPIRTLSVPEYETAFSIPFEKNWKSWSNCTPIYSYQLSMGPSDEPEYDDNGNSILYPVKIKLNSPVTLTNYKQLPEKNPRFINGYLTDVNFKTSYYNPNCYQEKIDQWIQKYWQGRKSTDPRFRSDAEIELLAKAIMKNGELDARKVCNLDPTALYAIEYLSKDKGKFDLVHYNVDEVYAWLWGYAANKYFNFFNSDEAVAFAYKHLGKVNYSNKVVDFVYGTPWILKAMREGWMEAGGTYFEVEKNYNMYLSRKIPSGYLIDGVSMTDAIEVTLFIYAGGSVKTLTTKVAAKMIWSAYLNWQMQIFKEMIWNNISYEAASLKINYSEMLWAGITSAIEENNAVRTLECFKDIVDQVQKQREVKIGIQKGTVQCLEKLFIKEFFKIGCSHPKSPYAKILKEAFKKRTVKEITSLFVNNFGLSNREMQDFLKELPSEMVGDLIQDQE